MTRAIVILKAATLLILIALHAPVSRAEQADVYTQIAELINTLEYLYKKGVDVTSIVRDLNTVIELASLGNTDEALTRLEQIKSKLRELEHIAEDTYIAKMAIKFVLVGFIASIPVAVYLILPRVYLHLWYSVRRKWIVRW